MTVLYKLVIITQLLLLVYYFLIPEAYSRTTILGKYFVFPGWFVEKSQKSQKLKPQKFESHSGGE